MSYWGDKTGGSVCVDRRDIGFYMDTDLDRWGEPRMEIRKPLAEWFEYRDLDIDWWLDDLGNLWFEFEKRAYAAIFKLDWNL